jgi:hypothetical protein
MLLEGRELAESTLRKAYDDRRCTPMLTLLEEFDSPLRHTLFASALA